MWGVRCRVWGGVTGLRESWLKSNGTLKVFESRAEAEQVAKRLDSSTNGNPFRTANFEYTAQRFCDL
jgi:hypothetical protein